MTSTTEPRIQLWIVFFVAMTVIGLETVSFQALSFVADYLHATEVLSVALLGLSAGGVLAWVWRRGGMGIVLTVFPLAVLATFPVIARLTDHPVALVVAMTPPYVLASLVISRMFAALPPNQVYVYDLVGAGISTLVVAVAIPYLREEGSFLLLTGIAALPLLLHARATGERTYRSVGIAFAVGAAVLLVAHLTVDPFNLLRHARGGDKLFNSFYDSKGTERFDLLYSRGSLIERIDIVARKGEGKKGPWLSVYNGRIVDAITSGKAKPLQLDNRLPNTLVTDPDSLLVGPSGQGLTKAVQALGNGHIDAVEINGAIAWLMANPMFKRSGKAYGGMDLTVGDVRTFLRRTPRLYDYITLLNTHRIWSMGHQGPPEYVHTIEAMRDYFARLKPNGWVLFEERNINERADLGIRRLLQTAKAAIVERGGNPADQTVIWEVYHDCSMSQWGRDPSDPAKLCKRSQRFTFVMLKNSAITPEDDQALVDWSQKVADRGPDKEGNYRGIVWRYRPAEPTPHYWTDVVRASSLTEVPDAKPEEQNLGIVTDDVPYPYDVYKARPEIDEMIRQVVGLAIAMVIVPAVLAFFGTRRRETRDVPRRVASTVLLVLFFGLLGLGYLLVEVVLMQKLAIFLSSPTYAFVVVLGTMLVASGVGGLVSAGFRAPRIAIAMATTVLLLGLALGIDAILRPLMVLPFALRVLAAILLVGPLAFLMGMPFPHMLGATKAQLSDPHAGLMFAVNGALSAIAAPVALVYSMDHGFHQTFAVGAVLYAACLVLLGLASLAAQPIRVAAGTEPAVP
jgi:hypothetical protein